MVGRLRQDEFRVNTDEGGGQLHVERFTQTKVEGGLSAKTIRNLLLVLQAILSLAVDGHRFGPHPARTWTHRPAVSGCMTLFFCRMTRQRWRSKYYRRRCGQRGGGRSVAPSRCSALELDVAHSDRCQFRRSRISGNHNLRLCHDRATGLVS
jgi:hypothetical protein